MSFIESPNFDAWLKEKVRHGTRRIKTLYIEQLMLLDVAAWTREHSEVEAVDFLLRLRDMLVCEGPGGRGLDTAQQAWSV
jgi:hypothetical protein